MFAVGLYQIIPITLNDPDGGISFLPWLDKYKKIDESTQKFNKEFQDLMPLFFWEAKRAIIGEYFRGKTSVENAAYAVSKEWASAGVPSGMKTEMKRISSGNVTYYDRRGLNKAHYSATKTIDALEKTKAMLDAYGGYDLIKAEGLSR